MSTQPTEMLELGQMRTTNQPSAVYVVENIGAGVIVTLYDLQSKIGGLACVILPESKLDGLQGGPAGNTQTPAKYADQAVPLLLEEFASMGGKKQSSLVRIVGGAQLFNFGGGGGNLLNIGVRNATAIRAALARQGYVIEKAETGGNKARSIRFELSTGKLFVRPVGSEEYVI